MSQQPRIVVTGLAAVSPIAVEDLADALYAGAEGLAPSASLPGAPLAGEVRDFDPKPWLGKKGVRVLDRCARLLAVAGHLALREGGLLADDADRSNVGLVAGTMVGGLTSIVDFDWSGVTDGPSYVSPMGFANTVINAPAGQSAIKHQLTGINSTISAGQASGLTAIQYAADHIALGRADYLLAGGAEELCPQTYEGLAANRLVSPGKAAPYSPGRDGVTPGEASALFLLETADRAQSRHAQQLAEIAGFASSQDAGSEGHPNPALIARTIQAALRRASLQPEQIAALAVSANGSPNGDRVEAEALGQVFGDRLPAIPAYAPKAAIGETLGAGGAFAAVTAALALGKQSLPPTPNTAALEFPISLSAEAQPIQGDAILITSVGFYGDCAALILRKWQ